MAYRDQTGDGSGGAGGSPPSTRANLLEYLTDMIVELRTLALKADAPLLACILELAEHEARERTEAARHPSPFSS